MLKPPTLLLLLLLFFLHHAIFIMKNPVALAYITADLFMQKKTAALILHSDEERKEKNFLFHVWGWKINYRFAHLNHTRCYNFEKFPFIVGVCVCIYMEWNLSLGCWLMPVASENEFFSTTSETHSMEVEYFFPSSPMLVLHFYSFDVEHEN